MNRIETTSYKLAEWSCFYTYPRNELSTPLCLPEQDVSQIENAYQITLPQDYREFITKVLNGGPGPYTHLFSLQESLAFFYLQSDPGLLSQPFPLTSGLNLFRECVGNMSFEEYGKRIEIDNEFDVRVSKCIESYSSPLYVQGTLPLCEYGCGIFFFLVVTGKEYGSIWVNDLGNEAGIFPLSKYRDKAVRVDFLTWYGNWLETQIRQAKGVQVRTSTSYFEYGFVQQ